MTVTLIRLISCAVLFKVTAFMCVVQHVQAVENYHIKTLCVIFFLSCFALVVLFVVWLVLLECC